MSTFQRILLTSTLTSLAACGISQEEHDKALADQKASLNAEMEKMQAAHKDESDQKNRRIATCETEVKRLGGTLSETAAKVEGLSESLSDTQANLAASQAEINECRRQRAELEKAAQAYQEVAKKLKSMVDSGKLEVVTRKGRMTLKLPDDILFPTGSKDLKKDGRLALEQVADVLKDVDRDFLIAGHTDPIPVKKGGPFKSNWDLSTARAVEVVKLMIAKGVAAERMAAAGFAEFDPVADNSTKEGRAQNRRLEIILMPKLEELPQLPKY